MSPIGDSLVRLLRDGAVIHEALGDALLSAPLAGAGVSRIEVDRSVDPFPIGDVAYRPWILSNAVSVRG